MNAPTSRSILSTLQNIETILNSLLGSTGSKTSPTAIVGAGKEGEQFPPAAASAVQPGEASPIASPGEHGKQYLVEPHPVEPARFNVDCGHCGEGRTLDPSSLVAFLNVHSCGGAL